MFNNIIERVNTLAIEQVAWAERELKGKSGKEKRDAVVKRIDDLIVLPAYLEWADDILIGFVVDKACEMFNLWEDNAPCPK